MRLGFRLLLPRGRSLCAERRLAGDTSGAGACAPKGAWLEMRGVPRSAKKIGGEKKGKKKRKKLSAERRRLIESQEDERRKAPVHLALHLCSTLSEAFTSNQ